MLAIKGLEMKRGMMKKKKRRCKRKKVAPNQRQKCGATVLGGLLCGGAAVSVVAKRPPNAEKLPFLGAVVGAERTLSGQQR